MNDGNIPSGVSSDTPSTGNIHLRILEDRDRHMVEENFVWADILRFRRYANGKHRIILTERQREVLRNLDLANFCDNVCGQIVNEATGRIRFKGFTCKNQAVKDWLDTFFAVRTIGDRQKDAHHRSLRDGNFAIAVNWNEKDGLPQIYKENWWDGIKGLYIHYNSSDEVEYAVKEWSYKNTQQVTISRRLIWFADRLEKYESQSPGSYMSWQPSYLEDDYVDGVAPESLEWLDENGEPLGVPYIHFKNAYRTYGNYGVSELDGGIIGWQDQLNDAIINMTLTARMTGGQQYYGTGIKLRKKDGTSEPIPIKVDAGTFHTSENADSRFGVLPAGNMDQQIAGYNLKLKRVAQITATPLHAITGGDWPSGDALLRSELPSVNKATDQIESFKASWCAVGQMALKIWNAFSPEKAIPYDPMKGIIEADFKDPEECDIISRSIVVHNSVGFISQKEGLRILGYTDEQADTIYDESTAEKADEADAMAKAVIGGPSAGTGGRSKGALGGGSNKPSANPQ